MKLAVGFITYNEDSAKYLSDFLPSLQEALKFLDPADYQVYAFDNSAPDYKNNEISLRSDRYQFIKYLSHGTNLGFSRAYNILINSARQSAAEYFFVINPDTILESGAIKDLVSALDQDSGLASVSPKIWRWDFAHRTKTKLIDSLGLILKPGLQFTDLGQGVEDWGQFDQATILGPSGAAGLFRLSALEKVAEQLNPAAPKQYFDERFFMYKEDCDLAYRLFLAGYTSRLVTTALVYHDRTAASSGQGLWHIIQDRRKKSRQVRSWSFRNQHLLFVKHWSKQSGASRFKIAFRILTMFIFSLILEQFLLKQYYYVVLLSKGLTDTK